MGDGSMGERRRRVEGGEVRMTGTRSKREIKRIDRIEAREIREDKVVPASVDSAWVLHLSSPESDTSHRMGAESSRGRSYIHCWCMKKATWIRRTLHIALAWASPGTHRSHQYW